MIVVKLIGGLGNQLFQYSVGRQLALLKNTELKLDITGFEEYKLHRYSLSHFAIRETLATKAEVARFQKYRRKPGRKWFLYNRLIADRNTYSEERQFHFDPSIFDVHADCYLDGYWQTEKYFKDIEDIIRKEVIVKTPLGNKDEEIADEMAGTASVSMHIRRGDYVSNAQTNQHHGTCDIEYYERAAEIIASKVADPHFFVFSDDHGWVKRHISLPYPVTYVDHNQADKNYEDLRLMSLCKHNIIANSSFSWWSAWLNQNKNKTVIAPREWFSSKKMDTRDIAPDTWIRI